MPFPTSSMASLRRQPTNCSRSSNARTGPPGRTVCSRLTWLSPIGRAPSGYRSSLLYRAPMLTWAEFEVASPEIAPRGLALLQRFQFVFVGTLTLDGSPRVSVCESYVIDGHLLLNMM